MKFKTHLKTSNTLIDLTPLVDVIFLLLIFFIVTSDVLPLKSLHIKNPIVDRQAEALTSQVLVVIDAQNVIYVGSKKAIVDLATLKKNIQNEIKTVIRHHPEALPTVVLSADRRVEYGMFLKVFSTAQECCERLRLVYQSVEEPQLEVL